VDDESGKSVEEDNVTDIGRDESQTDGGAVDEEKQGAASRDKVKHI